MCPDGGIGRRPAFRWRRSQARGGSSPLVGTKHQHRNRDLAFGHTAPRNAKALRHFAVAKAGECAGARRREPNDRAASSPLLRPTTSYGSRSRICSADKRQLLLVRPQHAGRSVSSSAPRSNVTAFIVPRAFVIRRIIVRELACLGRIAMAGFGIFLPFICGMPTDQVRQDRSLSFGRDTARGRNSEIDPISVIQAAAA